MDYNFKEDIQLALIRKGLYNTSEIIDKNYIQEVVHKNTNDYLTKKKTEEDEIEISSSDEGLIDVEDKDIDELDSEKCGKSSKYIVNSMTNAVTKFNTLYEEYNRYVKEIDDWYNDNVFEKHRKDDYTTYLLDEEYEKSDEGQAVLTFTHAVRNHQSRMEDIYNLLNDKQKYWGSREISIKDDMGIILDTERYNTIEKLINDNELHALRSSLKGVFGWYLYRNESYGDKTAFEEIKNSIDITNAIGGFDNQNGFLKVIEKMNVPLKSIKGNTGKLVDKLRINVANGRGEVNLGEDWGYPLEGDNMVDITPFYEED